MFHGNCDEWGSTVTNIQVGNYMLVDAVTCPGMQTVSPLFDFNNPDIYRTGNPKISLNHSE